MTSPPPELDLVPLEVRLVLHHLDETLQTVLGGKEKQKNNDHNLINMTFNTFRRLMWGHVRADVTANPEARRV